MSYFTHINYKYDLDMGKEPYTIIGNLIELDDTNSYNYFVYLANLKIPFIDKYPSLKHFTWVYYNADGDIQYSTPDVTNVPDLYKYMEELFTEEVFNNTARHRLNKIIGLV